MQEARVRMTPPPSFFDYSDRPCSFVSFFCLDALGGVAPRSTATNLFTVLSGYKCSFYFGPALHLESRLSILVPQIPFFSSGILAKSLHCVGVCLLWSGPLSDFFDPLFQFLVISPWIPPYA